MRLYRDYQARPEPVAAVALGAFDGVHLGHQALIRLASQLAQETSGAGGAGCGVVCFEPIPRQYFIRDRHVARLTSPAERLRILRAMGVQQTWQLRFNSMLASTSAEDFVRRVIIDGLRTQHVVVGSGFRFGAQRRGDVSLLREMGKAAGFEVHTVEPVLHQGAVVSSSRIRGALAGGELEPAAAMLGRTFSIHGRVRAGRRLGRDLGYPTANIGMPRRPSPVHGIFAVRVRITDSGGTAERGGTTLYDGVASLGRRPTVEAGEPLLEVHLFDFNGDLYHRRLDVFFIRKLRDEAHFPTIEAMVAQIHDDAAQARRILQQG